MRQSREDLVGHLHDQVEFLQSSGAAFDAGQTSEAKRLSTAIRILVHDTGVSKSLLGQLGVKDDLLFVDTKIPLPTPTEPGMIMVDMMNTGLAGIHMGEDSPYFAGLENRDRFDSKPFEEWWTTSIINDPRGNQFGRRELVLGLAHTDGGAHVDPELEEAYAELSRDNSLGLTFYQNDERLPDTSPVPANVRQIAFEVEKTILEQLEDVLAERP